MKQNLEEKIARLISNRVERLLLEGQSSFDKEAVESNEEEALLSQKFFLRLAKEVIQKVKRDYIFIFGIKK